MSSRHDRYHNQHPTNKHPEDEITSSSSDSSKSYKQTITEETQIINSILAKYEAEDNDSPETETNSEVNTDDMSGSEEEAIQYGDPSVNREDLPRVDFDYKNKTHVEKVIEAARSGIFQPIN